MGELCIENTENTQVFFERLIGVFSGILFYFSDILLYPVSDLVEDLSFGDMFCIGLRLTASLSLWLTIIIFARFLIKWSCGRNGKGKRKASRLTKKNVRAHKTQSKETAQPKLQMGSFLQMENEKVVKGVVRLTAGPYSAILIPRQATTRETPSNTINDQGATSAKPENMAETETVTNGARGECMYNPDNHHWIESEVQPQIKKEPEETSIVIASTSKM